MKKRDAKSENRSHSTARIHPTAEVSPDATVGDHAQVWHQAQVRERARIGKNCILGKGVYVDVGVQIGENVKIQNGCFVYRGVTLEDGVFLGPGVILSNDNLPRAINLDGTLKTRIDWEAGKSLIKRGASLGAAAVVLPNVIVGKFAMVGSASVVTRDVPDYGLVVGNPARLVGFVCPCGTQIASGERKDEVVKLCCTQCGTMIEVSVELWGQAGPIIRPLYR